jgi:hypothetical protein
MLGRFCRGKYRPTMTTSHVGRHERSEARHLAFKYPASTFYEDKIVKPLCVFCLTHCAVLVFHYKTFSVFTVFFSMKLSRFYVIRQTIKGRDHLLSVLG